MPYCIGFEIVNLRKLVAAEATTARQALLVIDQIQTRQQELKFIGSSQEGEIGVEMLDSWRKKKTTSWGIPRFEVVIACAVETTQSEQVWPLTEQEPAPSLAQ